MLEGLEKQRTNEQSMFTVGFPKVAYELATVNT